MQVVIVGAGEVGFHIADRLSREGHKITVIENSSHAEGRLRDKVNALVIDGSGASSAVLERAGIQDADLFIAVTNQDEVNLVACILANEYSVDHKIARVRSLEYTESGSKLNAKKLGIDLLINPQMVVADEICSMVGYTNAAEVAEFAGGRVLFLGYQIPQGNRLDGLTLRELREMRGMYPLVVAAIKRDGQTLIPRSDDTILSGDTVYLVCKRDDLAAVRNLFGFKSRETRNIYILGAGRVGTEVARRLTNRHHNVRLIDHSREHCKRAADQLDNVLVLCTSNNDVDTLRNEGIATGDVYISVTQDDQSNILGALLAKRNGVNRAIALVNDPELVTLAPSLGVDACISPRLATASAILKYIRRGDVVSVAMVEGSDAEVIELQLQSTGSVVDLTLREASIPSGATVGAIVRNEEVIIPREEDFFRAGDRVIVFTLATSVVAVEELFS